MTKHICVKGLLDKCNRECKLEIYSTVPNQCPDSVAQEQGLVPVWIKDGCEYCPILKEVKNG